jgi:hypothetical protein
MSMNTMLRATMMVLSLGIGTAYAAESEDGGTVPNTYFAELPGVLAMAPRQPPNVVVGTKQSSGVVNSYVVHSRGQGN